MVDFRQKLKEKKEAEALTPRPVRMSKAKGKRQVPEDYTPPPDLREFSVPLKAQVELIRLMDIHTGITVEQKKLKDQKDDVTKGIKDLCQQYDLDRFQTDGMQASYYPINKKKIDVGLLLAQGISNVQIIKATRVAPTTYGLKVSFVNDNSDREDNGYEDD